MSMEWRRWREKRIVTGGCLPKLQLLAGLRKIMSHTLLTHLKKHQGVSTSLEKKVLKIKSEITKP